MPPAPSGATISYGPRRLPADSVNGIPPRSTVSETAFIHVVDEGDYALHVRVLVVVYRKVAPVRTVEVTSLRALARHHLHVLRVHRIVARTDDERGHPDLSKVSRTVPARELATRIELA